jgi:hypothetical protein
LPEPTTTSPGGAAPGGGAGPCAREALLTVSATKTIEIDKRADIGISYGD